MKKQMTELEFQQYVEKEARVIKSPDFKLTDLQRYRYECIVLDKFIEDFKSREDDYDIFKFRRSDKYV
jgi:hypothetical protein